MSPCPSGNFLTKGFQDSKTQPSISRRPLGLLRASAAFRYWGNVSSWGWKKNPRGFWVTREAAWGRLRGPWNDVLFKMIVIWVLSMETLKMKCKLGETTFRWLHVIFSGYLVKLDGGINGVSCVTCCASWLQSWDWNTLHQKKNCVKKLSLGCQRLSCLLHPKKLPIPNGSPSNPYYQIYVGLSFLIDMWDFLWQQISGLQAFSGPISSQGTESIWVKKACQLICAFHSFHFRGARPPWPVVANWPFLPLSSHGEDELKTSKLYAPNNKDLTGFRPPICQMLFNHI